MRFGLEFGLYGGKGIGAGAAQQYLIQYLSSGGTFTFSTDANDKMELTNYGSSINGLSYAGAGLELDTDNELPLPVNYTLGSELIGTFYTYQNNTLVGNLLTIVDDDRGAWADFTTVVGETYLLDLTIISKTATTGNFYIVDPVTTPSLETQTVEFVATLTTTRLRFENMTNTENVEFTASAKLITTTGHLTYATDTDVVMLGNETDGGSSDELATSASVYFDGTQTSTSYIDISDLANFEDGRTYLVLGDVITDGLTGFGSSHGIPASSPFRESTSQEIGGSFVFATSGGGDVQLFALTGVEATWTNITITEVLPNSTTYTLPVSDTYRWAYVNENAFSTADLTALEANPNKIVEYALDNANSNLTPVQGTDDMFFGFRENEGEFVVDAMAVYGSDLISDWLTATWSNTNVTLNTAGGTLEYTFTASTTGTYSYSSVTTEVGKIYKYGIDAVTINTDVNDLGIAVYDQTNGSWNVESTTNDLTLGENAVIFEATGTTTRLYSFRTIDAARIDAGDVVEVENVELVEATAVEIANYVSGVRTNVDQSQYGIQWTCATLDNAGVPLTYTDTEIEFHGNEYKDTQWNPSLESTFWIEEVIDDVVYQHKYDGTSLTTYTDNVAGSASAHSPENADYLLGKGEYPQVAAGALATYTLKHFNVAVSTYDSYDQSARYTILAAI